MIAAIPDLYPLPCVEPPYPTEREINEAYLVAHGWTRVTYNHIHNAWEDPLQGGAYDFENALEMQEGRDLFTGGER